ncbi:S-layer homology domain-containing protein [Vermiculatibacterium agrestimuris]|uniref:S-layer homology domain-containing protein n=1 Tax=Vermiculatibacterium agrestimuris TaxID=2941519 RepID=UPI002407F49E|nr:S-layer homology domain-containing protein [Vermiculatibacterium agrestimuris]
MKKRILSTLLALTLCLGLLPTAAFAAGDSYGPDEEGWGYTTSEKVIDLGDISYDGTEKAKCGSFVISIENTGSQTLASEAFTSTANGLVYHLPAISIQPGDSADVTIQYTVPAGRDYKAYEDFFYILFDDAPVESMIQFLPQFTLVEANSSSGSGNYGDNVFVDEWGNRYQGVQTQPGGTSSGSGDAGTLSPSEAKSQYGISISPSHVDFGSCFVGDKVDPITITITNNGSHSVDLDYRGGLKCDDKVLHVYDYGSKDLAPGESRDLKVRLDTWDAASGTAHMEARLLLDGYAWSGMVGGGFGVGKSGTSLNISDFLTVDYEVKDLSDVKKGDIDWTISAGSIDFGVSDVPFEGAGFHKAEKETITITNQGSLPFRLEAEVDTSACERKDKDRIFKTTIGSDYRMVKAGESTEVIVWADSGSWSPGVVEGVLKFTAYYPDSKEQNTITADIPLSIKYLYDGGYVIANRSDNSYGTVKTSDGISRDPYSGNSRFTAKEGSSVTFVMTPYDPTAYHVSDIKINGKSVGTNGLVNNTYTISNIRDNYEFEAIFAPGAAPNPQQPATGAAEPAGWAKVFVEQAIAEGLLPAELQSAYDQPITRREFCLLADALYTKVKGGAAPVDATVTFTDTTDPAILRMASAKVVNGVGNELFDPNGQLTREQAATMLSRLAAALGKPLTDSAPTFDDNGSVAGWASAAVGQMQLSGIMSGTGNNQFSPQQSYTREQSVVTIVRMYNHTM